MKRLLIATLFILTYAGSAYCAPGTNKQDTVHPRYNYAVYFISPLSILSKVGFKLEARHGKTSGLVCINHYYDVYPGNQFALEGRRYFKRKPKTEPYMYGKAIFGHTGTALGEFQPPTTNYYGGGAGCGVHLSLRHFFFDLNVGGKVVSSENPVNTTFYFYGPGAFVDLHIDVGFQF